MSINKETILAERLRQQGLVYTAKTSEEYAVLFRQLQPVSPIYSSCPGDPPSLSHRTSFDDREVTSMWRKSRKIVKSRFLRGMIGYVLSNELELYANAFQRPLEKFSRNQELVLETLTHVGPLTPRQIKEETGLLNKELMPILHRLQQAFLVYEDQLDTDWERSWYIFSQEWPNVATTPDRWETAAQEVVHRLIRSHVFITSEQIKNWSGWSVRNIEYLIQLMQANGSIVSCNIDGLGEGWIRTEDASINAPVPLHSVFMLDNGDPLVRARIGELKRRFAGLEVLRYLLIDGDLRGAVCGHWRINPFDIEDIIVDLCPAEQVVRKDEIIQAVLCGYHPPRHRILRYVGEPLAT